MTNTNEQTTTTQTLSPVERAEARVAKAKAAAERAAERAKAALAKATERAEQAENRDVRLTEAKRLVREVVQAEAARRFCLCGCGNPTPNGFFKPGHDARLLALTLKELAAEGWTPEGK